MYIYIFIYIYIYIYSTSSIVWLPICMWNNPDWYDWNRAIAYRTKTQESAIRVYITWDVRWWVIWKRCHIIFAKYSTSRKISTQFEFLFFLLFFGPSLVFARLSQNQHSNPKEYEHTYQNSQEFHKTVIRALMKHNTTTTVSPNMPQIATSMKEHILCIH